MSMALKGWFEGMQILFYGEDVNYADAKFYRSAGFGVQQVPLNPDVENQKEKAKTPNLPQRIIRVVNSYVNEAKEPQPVRSKVLFKYTPKVKRKPNQKALIPVKEIVNTLVTSYTFPLRRIDPKENLVIRTSLENKRVVLRGSSSASSTDVPFSSTTSRRIIITKKEAEEGQ